MLFWLQLESSRVNFGGALQRPHVVYLEQTEVAGNDLLLADNRGGLRRSLLILIVLGGPSALSKNNKKYSGCLKIDVILKFTASISDIGKRSVLKPCST